MGAFGVGSERGMRERFAGDVLGDLDRNARARPVGAVRALSNERLGMDTRP
jgi:hypothetical protein